MARWRRLSMIQTRQDRCPERLNCSVTWPPGLPRSPCSRAVPADYLAKHAAAPGVRYLGLYGLQEIRDGHVWVDPRLEMGVRP